LGPGGRIFLVVIQPSLAITRSGGQQFSELFSGQVGMSMLPEVRSDLEQEPSFAGCSGALHLQDGSPEFRDSSPRPMKDCPRSAVPAKPARGVKSESSENTSGKPSFVHLELSPTATVSGARTTAYRDTNREFRVCLPRQVRCRREASVPRVAYGGKQSHTPVASVLAATSTVLQPFGGLPRAVQNLYGDGSKWDRCVWLRTPQMPVDRGHSAVPKLGPGEETSIAG